MTGLDFRIIRLFLLVVTVRGDLNENGSPIDNSQARTISSIQINSSVVYDGSNVIEITADNWSPPDVSPIFKAFRDFLFQERPLQRSLDDDLFPVSSTPEVTTEASEVSTLATTADKVIEMINNNLQEAITTLAEEIEAVTLLDSIEQSTEASIENKTKTVPLWNMFGFRAPSKRKPPESLNLTKSCSSCHVKLSSCVKQCFVQHDCRNIERSARECPVVAASFCNPFTPWSPVDQCQVDLDCESPLLCCNDGCVRKCSLGVWRT